jgi:hypothetical protein
VAISPGELPTLIDALSALVRSDGWKVYERFVMQQEEMVQRAITQAQPAEGVTLTEHVLRNAGALAQLKLLRSWPHDQLRVFVKQMEQFQATKEKTGQ